MTIDKQKKVDILLQYDEKESLHKEFLEYFYHTITGILKSKSIVYQRVDTRLKDRKSLEKKIKIKKKYEKIEDITDVCGMRIITYFSDDVDEIANLIRESFQIDEKNSVDKRESNDPTKFGYVSLHFIVYLKKDRITLPEAERFENLKIEIQIRTILQHAWAEIEHDLGYKTAGDIPSNIRRKFSRLAGQIELADEEFVRIKNYMGEYSKDIGAKIENNDTEVLIDIVSVKAFIQNDKEYLAVLYSLSNSRIRIKITNMEEVLNKHISYIVSMCADLKIKTILELKTIFNKYSSELKDYYNLLNKFTIVETSPLEDVLFTLNKSNNKDMSQEEFRVKIINDWNNGYRI